MVCRLSMLSSNYADVSLATWTEHHFMDDIQTRWYRSPEVILGAKWGTSADIWSVACVMSPVPTSLVSTYIDHFML
jgi:serine/threonine protein kinase